MHDALAEHRRQSRRLFALFRAVLARTIASAGDKHDYADRLEGRVGALARVQEMLFRNLSDGIDLDELIEGTLLAQALPAAQCRVRGPDTRITGDAALPLALAVHELTVNAIAHGGFLSRPVSLEIEWKYLVSAHTPLLQLSWQEIDAGVTSGPPTTKGFGLELLERSLPYELDACTRVDWLETGIFVDIQIPSTPSARRWFPTPVDPPS